MLGKRGVTAVTSKAPESSEGHEGMTDALNSNIDIVELGSSSDTKTNSPSSSSSSSISSSDEDDVPLSKMYSSLNKSQMIRLNLCIPLSKKE